MKIPPYSLVMGIPAKVIKTLDAKIEDSINHNALDYMNRAQVYKQYFDEI
jgi:carbonic anhydrase/acetyltransferase-like protein (isoleucine patch superfamily)